MADPTNQQQSWTDVVVSWQGGSVAVPEVTDLDVDMPDPPAAFRGGRDTYPSLIVMAMGDREFTVKGAALNVLLQIPKRTVCTVTATLNDLANGTGSGAVLFTAANALVSGNPLKGRNNVLATGELKFVCYSPDGTDPFTFSVVP